MEPSIMPAVFKAYEVAKLGEDREETWSWRPRGVVKSSSAVISIQRSCQCRASSKTDLELLRLKMNTNCPSSNVSASKKHSGRDP